MSKQNWVFRVSLPLCLLLLVGITACGETSSETGRTDVETPKTAVESTESTSGDERSAENGTDGAPTELSSSAVIGLSGDGVLIIEEQSGRANNIVFETDLMTAQSAISVALGEPTDVTQNEECGAGPMRFITWSNGFTINAMQDQFVGWTVRSETESAALTTVDGVGLGTTLADLEASYTTEVFESSLGIEFSASEKLFGLVSANEPNGVITNLWSGVACNFR